MKKYIPPRVEIVTIALENMLAGSLQVHNKYSSNDALTQRHQGWSYTNWCSNEE